jgi:hypothetical protein
LAGVTWFSAGAGLAIAQVVALWRTTRVLEPGRPQMALVLFIGGLLLRSGAVAALLLLAAKEGLSSLLYALLGWWLTRLICVSIVQGSVARVSRRR